MNNENLTLHFKVKDFNAWQTSYNGNEKDRTSAGITKSKVFRSADDPNDVLLLQDVADVSKARTWYGSNEMKSVMEKSGVVGSPGIRAQSIHRCARRLSRCSRAIRWVNISAAVPNMVPEFKKLDIPVLGVCGADDPYPDQPEVLYGMENFREAPRIPGAARFVNWQKPAEFNATISAFLQSLP